MLGTKIHTIVYNGIFPPYYCPLPPNGYALFVAFYIGLNLLEGISSITEIGEGSNCLDKTVLSLYKNSTDQMMIRDYSTQCGWCDSRALRPLPGSDSSLLESQIRGWGRGCRRRQWRSRGSVRWWIHAQPSHLLPPTPGSSMAGEHSRSSTTWNPKSWSPSVTAKVE
jgi:hypothetical protein